MKKCLGLLLSLFLLTATAKISSSSEFIPNIKDLTRMAGVIVQLKITGSVPKTITLDTGIKRKVREFTGTVIDSIKNAPEAGKDFSFTMLENKDGKPDLETGTEYMLFLKKYTGFEVYRFVGGGTGIFKMEKTLAGDMKVVNRRNNKNLFGTESVKRTVTGMKSLNPKARKLAEDQNVKGEIDLKSMTDIVRGIDKKDRETIKKVKEGAVKEEIKR